MRFKNFIQTIEEEVKITRDVKKVVAKLTSYDSAPYTRLANNIKRLEELEKEVKELKESIKSDTREHIQALFEAEDKIKTRVVETVSFCLVLSKDPEDTKTVKYKQVIDELAKKLTPELIEKMNELITKFTSVTKKSPSLTLDDKKNSLKESSAVSKVIDYLKNLGNKFLAVVNSWSKSYDKKLANLKKKI